MDVSVNSWHTLNRAVKALLPLLLLLSALAFAGDEEPPSTDSEPARAPEGWEPISPDDPDEPPINWVDTSHAELTNQAQALTEWMDAFFGDPSYDAEQAESFLRLEFVNDWDEDDGDKFRVRLRGKLQLPRISKRLQLVFSGEDNGELDESEQRLEDDVGLQYQVLDNLRSRVDLTLGWNGGDLRPGARYRYRGNFAEETSYQYIQQLQWESSEGFFTTGRFDINHFLDEHKILRWGNRVVWGEETDGVEWRTRLALRQRWKVDTKRPIALSYFGAINGVTDPDPFVKNYRVGMLWRRKIYREFLFIEVEPAWNYRRRNLDVKRDGAWSLTLRLEIALERDLRRAKRKPEEESPDYAAALWAD